MIKPLMAGAGLFAVSQQTVAGTTLGTELGTQLGAVLSSVLPAALPGGAGGAAGISALTLVIGAQLIKRRK